MTDEKGLAAKPSHALNPKELAQNLRGILYVIVGNISMELAVARRGSKPKPTDSEASTSR